MPKIVMAEIGDVMPARMCQSVIVRGKLVTSVYRQVVPCDARIGKFEHDSFGVIRAGVADYQQFEIVKSLRQDGGDGVVKRPAAIVGSDDDRNPRRSTRRPCAASLGQCAHPQRYGTND